MRTGWREWSVLMVLALGVPAAYADDPHAPAADPDPGFLEFLGSVDRLAEVNPDYLSQAAVPQDPKPPANAPAPNPPPPPPPPRQTPPAAANLPGSRND
jgi:hypothetical protein